MPSATKRLILCCDGSWTPSKPSSDSPVAHRPSNAARLSRMLARHGDDVPQIVFYVPGLGTTVEQDVASAYLFLAANFTLDDEIAVFGAGRGATVARLVVALVTEAGVLRAGEVGRWRDLWGLWTRRDRGKEGTSFWKDVLTHRSRGELDAIEELRGKTWTGVEDTEIQDRVPDGQRKYTLPDTTLNSMIDNAFQALAMDENRAAFAPALWRLNPKNVSPDERTPVLKQCWFPGFHETVSGCDGDLADPKDRTDIADITLAWMCDQVDGILTFDDIAVSDFLSADQITQNYSTVTNDEIRHNPKKRSVRAAHRKANSLLIMLLTHIVTFLTAITAILGHDTADVEDVDRPNLAIRSPGQYHKNLESEAGARPDDFTTNESVHPSVKHRQDLFALASVPYTPAPMREWPVGGAPQPQVHQLRKGLKAFFPSWTIDRRAAKGDDANNAINAASSAFLRHRQVATPHPEWTYLESSHGNGAKWVRPSVPRSSVFHASYSAGTAAQGSGLSLAWILFGPVLLVYRVLESTLLVGLGGHVGGNGLEWGGERQIELSEWVIREVPGRHNFEARLLPWLVREQLRWRNRNKLDWVGGLDEVWARAIPRGVGVVVPLDGAGIGMIEWGVAEVEVSRGKRIREVEPVGTGAVVKRRAGPLHIRKGSNACGVGADADRAVSPRNCVRRSVGGATSPSSSASLSTAIVRAGRASPEGSVGSAGGMRGGGTPTGDGLRALVQQPFRRPPPPAGKREGKERESPVFVQEHRKTHSQSSIGWR
ncbi:protein of unknown function DUF2235 [Macrophomina phaseolina MS6]|uniref:T6SS Phospholipase effector Tle1-like catalytic domain-containing protein n=1 Tax=Macrophomina phaseolina (strain MS6) TaxID=1126212 RepID=K2SFI7_MACPH|nr:protein of unknown function DUF2235 [Macrophomina phaseolina MS6]